MAQAIQEEQVTPADELRSLLTETEKLVANVPTNGEKNSQLLQNMDGLAELWPRLEEAGVDLRPEAGRWETIQAGTYRQAGRIVRALGPFGGLPALRARQGLPQEPAQPAAAIEDEERWWWYLDLIVRRKRVRTLRRVAGGAVIVVAALVVLNFAFNKLFPIDPKVRDSQSQQMTGQQIVQQGGDVQKALANFQQAAQLTPGDPDPWIWMGVAEEKLGRATEAQAAYAKARPLEKDEIMFFLARAQAYLSFAMPDKAQADLNAIFAQDPENPQGHYLQASIYEDQGQMTKAADELERTSTYAEKRNQTELTAMARYRMAMVIQSLSVRPEGAATPTATPTVTPAP
jgi:cytochrome c-type biogenesis protein CcmH/NrfG